MKTPIELIQEERERQINKEGWTRNRDDNIHFQGNLAKAAACYASPTTLFAVECSNDGKEFVFEDAWPWASRWDKRKKHSRMRQLQIAGALIVAEMERLQRLGEDE